MDRAVSERRRNAVEGQEREPGGDREGADDPPINRAVRCLVWRCRRAIALNHSASGA